jgi:hypothetical protein
MDVSVVVQTCDKYERFWAGFFYYMEKFWDKRIDCPLYFCNENKSINEKKFIQIKTGAGSFIDNLKFIINHIETEYIFYMIEDFWPFATLEKKTFEDIFNFSIVNNVDAFQVSPILPYYKLIETSTKINNQLLFKFHENSDWKFNFQTRFWKKDFLLNNLHKTKIPENLVNSTIGTEVESSKYMQKNSNIYFYHLLWYPISGVSYRGNLTNLGKEMQNNMMIDLYVKNYNSSSSSS